MKKLLALFLILTIIPTVLSAQLVERVEPGFWWTDMPVDELQLLIYGEDIGYYRARVNYPGVSIHKQLAVDSPNYLFVYLTISPRAVPGTMNIELEHQGKTETIAYELKQREPREGKNQGFDAGDVIYLMMPDRFANGNPENDTIEGMLESADRSNPERRQGGDIQGVIDNIDYIKELGMTTIWFTPTFENDMKPEYGAYHGYAATDLYKVDRRFGSNAKLKELVDLAHSKDMKVVMDMIHNHIGDQHWWMNDLPTNDWLHDFDTYGQTNFRGDVNSDPYASQQDLDKLIKGWFVPEMPDLNQRNEILADYLIQNTIWWIEYSGVDGIRMDTYVYPYREYMAQWAKEVMEAYPDFNITGESWVNNVVAEAYWQYDEPGVDDGYDSHLPSVIDFQVTFKIREALTENFGWEQGISKLYYVLSQDRLYADPMQNIVFLDNHDMGRFYNHVGEDEDLLKMAYGFLMTVRGIPQVYYGTELMLSHQNRGGDDEGWRQTLPGTFEGDTRSVFTEEGRTVKENEMYEYISALTNWRKEAIAIHEGSFLHFVPENNTYVYFRIHDKQTVMVVMNRNETSVLMQPERFAEVLQDFTTGENVLTGEFIDITDIFEVPGKTTAIFELR